MRSKLIPTLTASLLTGGLLVFALSCQQKRSDSSTGRGATKTPNDTVSSRAFLAAYPVFMHPRCLNCHPKGDAPLQGEDSHPHSQHVTRGPDGKGVFAAKCTNCHQPHNLPGAGMPPGSATWHLPKPEMPLVFEGLDAAELCEQLKDPQQNGGRSLEQVLHHVTSDPLVLWGWDPGDGRQLPPLTHQEFSAKMQEWYDNGASCPN